MSYKFQRIILNNLKFISDKKHEDIDFESADLVILNGPNGYGKSTVFDAIELLITGDIKHFNDELLNKGTLSKSILANNSNENVIISSVLIDEEKNQFPLKRTFVCNDKFDSIIEWQDNKISQEKLYEILQINENLFDIGIYISQSESLKFFEQKYKDRKTLISGILDDSESFRKKEKLITFDNKLKVKKDELLAEGKKKLEDIKKKKEEIDLIMKKVGDISDEVGYVKLFDTDYDFDQENIKFSLEYDLYTAPLIEIKQFILDYDKYEKSKLFYILNKIENFNDNVLKAIMYKDLILEIKNKNVDINYINSIQKLIGVKSIENVSEVINSIILTNEQKEKYIQIVAQYNVNQAQLGENEKIIKELTNKCKNLWSEYSLAIEKEIWNKNKCPLCGRDSDDLNTLYTDTINILSGNNSILGIRSEELKLQALEVFDIAQTEIDNKKIQLGTVYSNYLELKEYLNIDISHYKEAINEFTSRKLILKEVLNQEQFLNKKNSIKNEIQRDIEAIGEIIELGICNRYDDLKNKYYSNKPLHTIKEIDDKIIYINYIYSNNYRSQYDEICLLYENEEKLYIELEQKYEVMSSDVNELRKNYEKAYKNYQSKLVEKIRMPLYLYGGKLLQTYPMGLGVNIQIDTNQVVFQTDIKEDDIFNYLSMGQLNGVILSVLLAIRSIVNIEQGLNIILVDDPLQSIDDISACSFADVISTEFSDSQMIFSTHEEDKSNMLEYKFVQEDKNVKTINMHNKYIGN